MNIILQFFLCVYTCNIFYLQVHFPHTPGDLTKVRRMVLWPYAHQVARKGPWEQYARDTERFKKRIADVECAIKHVLENDHRQTVFEKYHSNLN